MEKAIKSFAELTAHLQQLPQRVRLAVVCGSDDSTREAVTKAVRHGFAEATFVGHCSQIASSTKFAIESTGRVCFVEAADDTQAAQKAVQMVREGEADVLVKGLLHTETLLHAVLNKEWGLLPNGNVLTHIAVAEMPRYDKLFFFSDAAVIPYPTHEQRLSQVAYMARLLHAFGIEEPRIALTHCAETVNPKFPHTLGYAEICQRAAEGEWGALRVDGPLDLRTACDPIALRVKGINSCLEGQADAIIVPDIEAGNLLYKALPLFAQAKVAGSLQGTLRPVVLPSRGDDAEAKFNSIALAAINI